ncbi:MFS transporter [Paenibacillus flagellatus]|uniref:MFS transporter n=1 Tax=Paenibacillus flagellatus TaxID=2211139 RepID=A0A2V5K5M9_9BACL|nr:MFS transporter [Paenibacillus flagellatus]PYI53003.1 MFS transporter [Paenibacillus flagellatus]
MPHPQIRANGTNVPPDDAPRANRWSVMHIVNLGTFMNTLDVGIVQLALPTMAAQFGTTLAGVQWIVTSYLLTMVALLPIVGKLSDRLSRKTIYSAGFLLFAIGSLFAALSGSLAAMIASRCVQGAGAAMIMANSQAMVRALFPDRERGRALGVNTIVMSAGTLAGPAAGGFLMEFGGWPLLFWINVPIGIVATVLGLRLFPDNERNVRPLDLFGSALLAIGTSVLLYASVASEENGFSSSVLLWGGFGLVLLVVLVLYERKLEHGILDPVLYRNRAVGVGNLSAFLFYAAQMGSIVPLTFYMQDTLGLSTRTTGLLLAIQPVAMALAGPLAGYWRDRRGAFGPTTAGACCCALAMAPAVVADGVGWGGAAFYCGLFGFGSGLFLAANNADIMGNAPADKASLVGSMLALIRYLGMIVGTGLAVLFAGSLGGAGADAFAPGTMRILFALCALLALGAMGVGWLRPRLRAGRAGEASSG